jgi:hypothetical protein
MAICSRVSQSMTHIPFIPAPLREKELCVEPFVPRHERHRAHRAGLAPLVPERDRTDDLVDGSDR